MTACDVAVSIGRIQFRFDLLPSNGAEYHPSLPLPLQLRRSCHRGAAVKIARNRHCTAEEVGAPCGASFISFHRTLTNPCGVPYCSGRSPVTFWLAGKTRRGVGPEKHPPDANRTKLKANSGWTLSTLFLCYEGYLHR